MAGSLGENIAAIIIGVPVICVMIYFPILFIKIITYDAKTYRDIDEADGTSYVTLPNGDRRLDDTESGYGE